MTVRSQHNIKSTQIQPFVLYRDCNLIAYNYIQITICIYLN